MSKNLVLETACRLCYPNAVDYGELIPGYFLVLNSLNYDKSRGSTDEWFLTDNNGHDKYFAFQGKPRLDPYHGMSDEEIDAVEPKMAEFDSWYEDAAGLKPNPNSEEMSIPLIMDLAMACYLAGWKNPDIKDELYVETVFQDPRCWLYERAANLIARRESDE